MNELEIAIQHAISAEGSNKEANKAYLEFIKANFIIPIEKNSATDDPEVLYLEVAKPPSGQQHQITIQAPSSTLRGEGDIEKGSYSEGESQVFLPVFTSLTYFDHWARDIKDDIQLLKLSGVDLLKGIGEHVIVSLNIGSDLYKEFNPSELARMRSMVLKLFKI